MDLSRLRPALVALALLASSCTLFSANGDGEVTGADLAPPPSAPPGLTARPGLVLHSNSESLGRILGTPEGEGVVVMFVQPDGPSEGTEIERGDLLVEIDGERVTNHERAAVMLRVEPNQELRLRIRKVDGGDQDVTIVARNPGAVQLADYYNRELQRNPNDAINLFLRGWESGPGAAPFEQRLEDVNTAIGLVPDFVEAIALRAGLLWDRSSEDEIEEDERAELRRRATEDWEAALELAPEDPNTLVSRSRALSQSGQAARAKADAEMALEADDTFPAAQYALGLAEYRLANYEEAGGPARRAIDLNPFHFVYYQLMGSIFVRLGQQECLATADALSDLLEGATEAQQQLRQVCET